MSANTIPDDVMRAAAELIEALSSWDSPIIKRQLAETYLLAERQRCARIVTGYRVVSGEPGMMTVRPASMAEIERAILNPPSVASSRAEQTGEAVPPLASSPVAHSDWITWNGGDRPHPPTTVLEVKFRDGTGGFGESAFARWQHTGSDSDLIAYRVIEPAATNLTHEEAQ